MEKEKGRLSAARTLHVAINTGKCIQKQMFLSKKVKAIVDIAMILCIVIALVYSDPHTAAETYWCSSHCIISLIGLTLMAIHVTQHWHLIKAFTKRKVILKNKITALVIASFILISLSILLFIIGFSGSFLKFHSIIGHFLGIMVLIHTVQKFKRFILLLKNK